jgi:hypothetical protein
MQITTLIIAPVFFTAALYVLLGVLIKLLGRQSSLLSARMYAIMFVTCDVISLVVQVSGLSRKDFSLMPVSLAISQDHACLILMWMHRQSAVQWHLSLLVKERIPSLEPMS